MIAHYLKVAVRNLLKYKTQTFISIIGLAIGFVCFALSAYWIHYEMNYDSFHRDADRIYWVSANSRLGLPYPIGNYWHKNYVEIEDYAVFEIYGQGLYFNKKRSSESEAFPKVRQIFLPQTVQASKSGGFDAHSIVTI